MTQSANGIEGRDDRTSIDKAMDLLRAFGPRAHGGVGVSELARRARMSKSTAFRLLGMLELNGAVERLGSGYRLGSSLHELGSMVYAPGHDRIRDVLTPYLADLYELTHGTVHLAVLHGADVVYLNKLHGHRPARSPSQIGGRAPAYATAVGKVLLAADGEAVRLTRAAPLVAWTERTVVDVHRLDAELAEVRRTGLAFDRGELDPGLNCLAAQVAGPDGRAVAAMSVSCTRAGFNPAVLAPQLRRICHLASRAITSDRLRRAVIRPGSAPERRMAVVDAS